MSRINPLARELSLKLVYYGPGLSGKTTSLRSIHKQVNPTRRGNLLTIQTDEGRTILFDFLPLHVERIREMSLRFALYTVPGQVFYTATRKLVLNGADGVVFAADRQLACRDANIQSLADLESNLQELGIDLHTFPLVFQYNKSDLANTMSQEQMGQDLNRFGAPEFCTDARGGQGVMAALKISTKRIVKAASKTRPRRTAPLSGPSRPPKSSRPGNGHAAAPASGGDNLLTSLYNASQESQDWA